MSAADDRASLRPGGVALTLFILYCCAYAGFIVLASFRLDLMKRTVEALGVNVAVLYGFGLIVGAFGIALLYMLLRRGATR